MNLRFVFIISTIIPMKGYLEFAGFIYLNALVSE